MEFDLKKTLEALLLSTAEPIDLKALVSVFTRHQSQTAEASKEESEEVPESSYPKVNQKQISAALAELIAAAETENKFYRIFEGPNGYQIVTAPQFAEFVRLLRSDPRPTKLSAAALETLSIIAYRQPVTRAEIEAIRGVSVDGPLNRLIELEMAQVTGRAELPGRPIQYGTTDHFLEFVGIKDLDALPSSDVLSDREIDDWVRRDAGSKSLVSDQDVGLADETHQGVLDLNAHDDDSNWRLENIESDAALNN